MILLGASSSNLSGIIERQNNVINISGRFSRDEFKWLLSNIHQSVEKAGYQDITLNFTACSYANAAYMVGLCSQIIKQVSQAKIKLELPEDKKLANLFLNSNWAYLIDPSRYEESPFQSDTKIPSTKFSTSQEQQKIVDRVSDVMLRAISNLNRRDFAALEWAVGEITDNVLTHSECAFGGLVQVTPFDKTYRRVELVVSDAGLGIPKTLRDAHSNIKTDIDALDKAIREGVTRGVGQGNGLFGTYQLCSQSGGSFSIYSGYARLTYTPKNGLHVAVEKIPFNGTLVIASIDLSSPHLLETALKFQGVQHTPVDFIEINYESNEGKPIEFLLANETQSFMNRFAGTPVRNKLKNILSNIRNAQINVDFSKVAIISSSFADEAFAKLFVDIGPLEFSQKIKLIKINDMTKSIIDKSIRQRLASG